MFRIKKWKQAGYFNQHLFFIGNLIWSILISALTPVWPDRDDFITLNEENMRSDLMRDFVKRPFGDAEVHTSGSVNHQHTPYDVLSVIVSN